VEQGGGSNLCFSGKVKRERKAVEKYSGLMCYQAGRKKTKSAQTFADPKEKSHHQVRILGEGTETLVPL